MSVAIWIMILSKPVPKGDNCDAMWGKHQFLTYSSQSLGRSCALCWLWLSSLLCGCEAYPRQQSRWSIHIQAAWPQVDHPKVGAFAKVFVIYICMLCTYDRSWFMRELNCEYINLDLREGTYVLMAKRLRGTLTVPSMLELLVRFRVVVQMPIRFAEEAGQHNTKL